MRATQGNSVARTELQKVAVLDDPVMEGRSKCKVDAGIPITDGDDSDGRAAALRSQNFISLGNG